MDALFDPDAATTNDSVLLSLRERRQLRRDCELSLHQVASACSVSEATVRAWEGGTATPCGNNAAVYQQLLQGLRAYLTQTPLHRSAVALPDWAALGGLHRQIPFQDTTGETCWRCQQPTAQRVGGRPQHLGTRCPAPSPAAGGLPTPALPPDQNLFQSAPQMPTPPPAKRLDYPVRGRSMAAGPLAVLEAGSAAGLTAHLTDGSTRHCPADTLPTLLSWATTAGLGAPAVRTGGLNAGPLLVLTDAATVRLSLPLAPPPPAQRHPRSDHPALVQLRSVGWQTDSQGLGAWSTIHPSNADPDADCMHLAVTAWGALYDDWQLPPHLDAAQLACFLGTYTRLLRIPIGSLGACGHRLMSDLRPPAHYHAATGELLCPGVAGALTRCVDPVPCEAPEDQRLAHGRSAADKVAVGDINWWRTPTNAEAAHTYVTCLAVNLLHVADSNNIRVADSPAQLVEHPPFDRKTPGSWLVDLSGPGQHPHLPAPYPADGLAWHPTPAVAYAQSRGRLVAPVKGYLRPGPTRPYLDPWYRRIRDAHLAALERLGITADMPPDTLCHAIQQLDTKDDADLALLRAVHTSALQGIDLLARQPADPDHIPGQLFDTPRTPTWRPDLYASVIANARANLRRKLGTTARTGRFPLAVYQDHILYATHTPDVREITDDPGSGFRLGLSPGQVRPAATRTMDWYLQNCASEANPAQLLKDRSPW